MVKKEVLLTIGILLMFYFSIYYINFTIAITVPANTTIDLSATGDWFVNIPEGIVYDGNNNLVYIVGQGGEFGVYNRTSNISINLNETDTGNFIGSANILRITYDSNADLVYLGGGIVTPGRVVFAVYNRTSDVTENLNSTDSGGWFADDQLQGIAYDSNNDLVYIGPTNSKFGVYNRTSNISTDLSTTDAGDWLTPSHIQGLVYDNNNDLVYVSASSGKFGVYNRTSNVLTDLSATDTGDWMGTSTVAPMTYDSNNDLVYIGVGSGKFGVYNRTSNVLTDLSATDTGDWIGTSGVAGLVYDSSNDLLYMGISGGKFGVYNRTSNISTDLSATDTSDFIGTSGVNRVAYDNSTNLIYLLIRDSKFGVYSLKLFEEDFPEINFVNLTTNTSNLTQTFIEANVTVNDASLDTITIYLYNSTSLVNSSISSTSPLFVNFTNLSDGTYYLNATANDSRNLENSTETRTIILDTTPPSANFVSPTTSSGAISNSTILANITSSDSLLGLDTIIVYLYNSTSLVQSNTSSISPLFVNFTNLTEGNYTLNATTNDTLNNQNSTETRNITLDTTAPIATLTCSPSTVTAGNTVTCNCSGTDSGSGVQLISYTENPSTSSLGTFTTSCTVTDNAGNSGNTTAQYVVESASSGGGSTTPTTTQTTQQTNIIIKITPETGVTIGNFDEDLGIKEIQIEVNNETQNVKITILKYDGKPEEVTKEKTGNVYKYLEIKTENLEDKLEKAIVTIQVEKSWISNNSLNKEDVALFKFDNNSEEWEELPTNFTDEDNIYYFYNTELDSFSFFVIGEKPSIMENIISGIIDSHEKASETIFGLIVWWLVVLIFVVAVSLVLIITIDLIKREWKAR